MNKAILEKKITDFTNQLELLQSKKMQEARKSIIIRDTRLIKFISHEQSKLKFIICEIQQILIEK